MLFSFSENEKIVQTWREYFQKLMNEENPRIARSTELYPAGNELEVITEQEVKTALTRMKNAKAVGPDNIPIEVWKSLGKLGIEYLTKTSTEILEGGKMPEEFSHSIKLFERIKETRLGELGAH